MNNNGMTESIGDNRSSTFSSGGGIVLGGIGNVNERKKGKKEQQHQQQQQVGVSTSMKDDFWMLKAQPPPPPPPYPNPNNNSSNYNKSDLVLKYDNSSNESDDNYDNNEGDVAYMYKENNSLLMDSSSVAVPHKKKKIFSKLLKSFSKKSKSKKNQQTGLIISNNKSIVSETPPPPPPPPLTNPNNNHAHAHAHPNNMAVDEQSEVSEMTNPTFLLISPKTLNSDITNPTFFNENDVSPAAAANNSTPNKSTPLKTINPVILLQDHHAHSINEKSKQDDNNHFWKMDSDFIEWNQEGDPIDASQKLDLDNNDPIDNAFPLLQALNNYDNDDNDNDVIAWNQNTTIPNDNDIDASFTSTHDHDNIFISNASNKNNDSPPKKVDNNSNDDCFNLNSFTPKSDNNGFQISKDLNTHDDSNFLSQNKSKNYDNAFSPNSFSLKNKNSKNDNSFISSKKNNISTSRYHNTNNIDNNDISQSMMNDDEAFNFRLRVMQVSSPREKEPHASNNNDNNNDSDNDNNSNNALFATMRSKLKPVSASNSRNIKTMASKYNDKVLQSNNNAESEEEEEEQPPKITKKSSKLPRWNNEKSRSNKLKELLHKDSNNIMRSQSNRSISNEIDIFERTKFKSANFDDNPTDEEGSNHHANMSSPGRSYITSTYADESDESISSENKNIIDFDCKKIHVQSYPKKHQPQHQPQQQLSYSYLSRQRSSQHKNNSRKTSPGVNTTTTATTTFLKEDPIQIAGVRLLSAAAIPIQAEIRRFLAQRIALNRMWAIVTLQSYFRRFLSTEYVRTRIFSAIFIQAVWKGYKTFLDYHELRFSAIEVQRVVRGHLTRIHALNRFESIIVIQTYTRRFLVQNHVQNTLVAVLRIQSTIRAYLARLDIQYKHGAATCIQSVWRMYVARLWFQFDLVDIIIVQSISRRWLCRKRYLDHRSYNAAIKIQTAYRTYYQTMNYLHTMADILIIQSIARRRICRKRYPSFRYHRVHELVTRIQCMVRSFKARKQYQMLYWKAIQMQSAIIIQRNIRRYLTYNYHIRHRAAIKIQAQWRCFQLYTDYIFLLTDIVIVQRTVRAYLARDRCTKRVNEQAAITIQRYWRGYTASMDFMFILVRIIMAQRVIRRYIARKQYLNVTLPRHRASIIIQRNYRFYYHRHMFLTTLNSAIKIQTTWRGYVHYSNYIIHKFERHAAITIQRYWRGFRIFSQFVILTYDVIRIQSCIRSYLVRVHLRKLQEYSIKIQSICRIYLAKKLLRSNRMSKIKHMSRVLSFQYFTVCKRIQRAFRNHMLRKRHKIAVSTIERFFVFVKAEVDRKVQIAIATRREADEQMLERIWLNTCASVQNDYSPQLITKHLLSSKSDAGTTKSKSRSSRINKDSILSLPQIQQCYHLLQQEKNSSAARFKSLTRKQLSDDLSLEEAFIDAEIITLKQQQQQQFKQQFLPNSGTAELLRNPHLSRSLPRHKHKI